jgi:hypothetical protein
MLAWSLHNDSQLKRKSEAEHFILNQLYYNYKGHNILLHGLFDLAVTILKLSVFRTVMSEQEPSAVVIV